MTKDDREYILSVIDQEGFDYTFVDYSDFKAIKDKEFHKLRKAYIDAHKALEQYING